MRCLVFSSITLASSHAALRSILLVPWGTQKNLVDGVEDFLFVALTFLASIRITPTAGDVTKTGGFFFTACFTCHGDSLSDGCTGELELESSASL
jgi:hypothetical protein